MTDIREQEIQPKALPKSALGKAVNYALNHQKRA